MATKEISSLSAELVAPATSHEGSSSETKNSPSGFTVAVFDVPKPTPEEMEDFRKREEEFELVEVPFNELPPMDGGTSLLSSSGGSTSTTSSSSSFSPTGNVGEVRLGLMCAASTDEAFVERWGQETFDAKYRVHGVETIWAWPSSVANDDSDDDETNNTNNNGGGREKIGILPCACYLRHCVLAVSKPGVDPRARDSFLDETFLADRATTIRQYLADNPHVMESEPPPSLIGRYSG